MEDDGAVIYRLAMVRNPFHPKNLVALMRLRKLVARLRPVAVHGHSSIGGAFARAATIGSPVPAIYTPNGVATNRAVVLVEKLLAPLTTRFIAASESEGARALSLGLIKEDRLVVIRNGIDLGSVEHEALNLRHDLGLPPEVPLVGTVARLAAQKAPEQFIAVCAEVHRSRGDVHFVLIGNGELQPQLDAAVRSAGLESHFHQLPFLPVAALAIEQFDVFVLASLFEGGPYAPLEAMRGGVPVVLSEVMGNADTVEHNSSGLLYDFGDTSAMADGVLRLLSDDPFRTSVIGAAAVRLREKFDRKDMGARLGELYRELSLKNG
jgi:glycosyltransferase involved in cell wall biosynthesis